MAAMFSKGGKEILAGRPETAGPLGLGLIRGRELKLRSNLGNRETWRRWQRSTCHLPKPEASAILFFRPIPSLHAEICPP